MKDLLRRDRVVLRTSNVKISSCHLADHVKKNCTKKRALRARLFVLIQTNQIIDLWRWRFRCRFLNSLLLMKTRSLVHVLTALCSPCRGATEISLDYQLPTCPRVFNIFHPYDPVVCLTSRLMTYKEQHVAGCGKSRSQVSLSRTWERGGEKYSPKALFPLTLGLQIGIFCRR